MRYDPATDDFAKVVNAAKCAGTSAPEDTAMALTGMVPALLREIADHCRATARDGALRTVTLRGLPISQGDYSALRERLGTGEVTAVMTAPDGQVEITETRLNGVWWLRVTDADGTVTAEHIEIASVPSFIAADPADIRAAAARLESDLDTGGDATGPRSETSHQHGEGPGG